MGEFDEQSKQLRRDVKASTSRLLVPMLPQLTLPVVKQDYLDVLVAHVTLSGWCAFNSQ